MGGFDIYVKVDTAVLNPTSAALGTLIASPSLTSICVSGLATIGSCTVGGANGRGVVEVTTLDSSGGNECGGLGPCSGLAFTITYNVVAAATSTPISYPIAPGCSNTSVSSPANMCVLVDDAFGTSLSENIQGANVTQTVVTAVSCNSPLVVGTLTVCTATVTDASTSPTNPTGIVTFSTDGPGSFGPFTSCNLTNVGTDAANCTLSYAQTVVNNGYVNIGASYGGDATHSASTAAPFPLIISKATPVLTTSVSSTSIPVGGFVTDQATLEGGYPSTGVSGYVDYYIHYNGVCSELGHAVSTVVVGSGNSVGRSGSWQLVTPGNYSFDAIYLGDGKNYEVISACEPFTATMTSKDFGLTPAAANVVVLAGSTVTDRINVTSVGAFSGLMALTNSTVPAGVTVTFVPDQFIITALGALVSVQIAALPTVRAATFGLVVTGTSGSISHRFTINVTIIASAPMLKQLKWDHDLSLPAIQNWKASVFNPQKNSVNVVIRIVGVTVTQGSNMFDVVCGKTCIATLGGSVDVTPGLSPVSIDPGGAARLKFNYSLGQGFQEQTVRFTATLYWTVGGGTSYILGNEISGTFFVEGND